LQISLIIVHDDSFAKMLSILKTIFFMILSPFKSIYGFFCKKKCRKFLNQSNGESNVNPVSASNSQNYSQEGDHHVVNLQFEQSWDNDWTLENEADKTTNKIEQYRNQLKVEKQKSNNSENAEENPDVNFFVDMEPQNVRQAKVFVGQSANNTQERRNRLSVSASDQVFEESDPTLRNWEEENQNESLGWEAEEDDITDVLKEHRKMRKMNVAYH